MKSLQEILKELDVLPHEIKHIADTNFDRQAVFGNPRVKKVVCRGCRLRADARITGYADLVRFESKEAHLELSISGQAGLLWEKGTEFPIHSLPFGEVHVTNPPPDSFSSGS